MLDSNPGPLAQKSGALPMSPHISTAEITTGPSKMRVKNSLKKNIFNKKAKNCAYGREKKYLSSFASFLTIFPLT